MTNLIEQAKWHEHINQLEPNEFITGGTDGNINLAPKQLADRTLYLLEYIKNIEKKIGSGAEANTSSKTNTSSNTNNTNNTDNTNFDDIDGTNFSILAVDGASFAAGDTPTLLFVADEKVMKNKAWIGQKVEWFVDIGNYDNETSSRIDIIEIMNTKSSTLQDNGIAYMKLPPIPTLNKTDTTKSQTIFVSAGITRPHDKAFISTSNYFTVGQVYQGSGYSSPTNAVEA